jgi:hypothetical protein
VFERHRQRVLTKSQRKNVKEIVNTPDRVVVSTSGNTTLTDNQVRGGTSKGDVIKIYIIPVYR